MRVFSDTIYSSSRQLLRCGIVCLCFVLSHILLSPFTPLMAQSSSQKFTLVIHGGAGVITRANLSPEREKEYHRALDSALRIGYDMLAKGETSVMAVEKVVNYLEDNPLFNAGIGAVYTADGTHELDAAIMDGKTLSAGAVAAVKRIKNPISLARLVMEKSEHVMLIGTGAEAFAETQGVTFVPNTLFDTPARKRALERIQQEEREQATKDSIKQDSIRKAGMKKRSASDKHGTVGAVALDVYGNLAAATSTGGMTNKRFGRVGDAPIIGAGTYANNASCAVSATGWGEYFIRTVVAHDVSALIEYKGLSVQSAGQEVINKVGKLGGDGGMIILDRQGNIAMPFNSEGMYRGMITHENKPMTAVYK